MRSTFNILFYLKKNSVKKTGYAPLMVRITINGVMHMADTLLIPGMD